MNEKSVFANAAFIPNGMSLAEFEWWLKNNGYTVLNGTSYEKDANGEYHYPVVWVKKENTP